MKQFVIGEPLAQAVLDYLSTKPYREVSGLIQGMTRLQPVPEPEPDARKKEKA